MTTTSNRTIRQTKLRLAFATSLLSVSFIPLANGTEPSSFSAVPVVTKTSAQSAVARPVLFSPLEADDAAETNDAPVKTTSDNAKKKRDGATESTKKRSPAPVVKVSPRRTSIVADEEGSKSKSPTTAQNATNELRNAGTDLDSALDSLTTKTAVSPKSTARQKRSGPVSPALEKPVSFNRPKVIVSEAKSGFDWTSASASRSHSDGQLSIGVRQAGSLRAGTRVSRCEIENEAVCEALHFEPTELSIVGKMPGETRIAIWLDEQPEPLFWHVKVAEQKKASTTESDNSTLSQLLGEMFPQSRVRLSSTDGELIVQGKAKNRKEAVQIVSFIRSVRLIPVVDRLTVQGK